MMRTPASTRSSHAFCASPAGTASTPTTMFFSRTTSFSRRSSSTAVPPTSEPIFSGSRSKTAATLIPCSAKIDERAVVLPLRAQDAPDLDEQRLDRVADAALAELAEVREVAADLRRVDVRVVGDLLRGDAVLAHLLGLRQHLQVPGQAGGHADPDAVVRANALRALQHAAPLCPNAPSGEVGTRAERRLVDAVDGHPLPVRLDHGQPGPVDPLELGVAGDVELLEVEAELLPQPLELDAGGLAEVAAASDDEPHPHPRYG